MLIIPGVLIGLLAFPGIILHEYAHKLGCNLVGIEVYECHYFRFKNPMGYILHEHPSQLYQSVVITLAPLIICYGGAAILALVAFSFGNAITWVLAWLSISLAINGSPSDDDLNTLWLHTSGFSGAIETEVGIVTLYEQHSLFARGALYPIMIILKIINALKVLWIDVVIGILILLWAMETCGYEF